MSADQLSKTEPTPMVLMQQAMADPSFDTSKMEKLMELQERWEGNQAKKAFNAAMVAFQSEMPAVYKARNGPQGKYYFANYEDVMRVARPVLKANKLAVRFEQKEDEESVTIVCHVIHEDGHSETTEFTGPKEEQIKNAAGKSVTSKAQAQGSTNSYYKRYCVCNALDIVVSDEDDDGALGGEETLSDKQAAEIKALLESTGSDVAKFLKWAGAKTVETITVKRFDAAKAALTRKGVAK